MMYYEIGSENHKLTATDLQEGLNIALQKLGERKKVLVIPPDFTRFHSKAGELTSFAYQFYKDKISDILPALGTHVGMTPGEIEIMYPGVPHNLFRVHDWRNDVVTVGKVPGSFVSEITNGGLDYDWPAQVNKLIWEGGHDLILSIGQVVPHEVIGMANYNKNIFVGTGGSEGINKSHFVGAVYGMENVMGRADNPVRKLLNYASEHFTSHLPIVYIHTVVGRDTETGKLATRGLFIGDDYSVFTKAAELSLKVNFTMLDRPIKKAVVYLDPTEFKSTWLGNKSIYRTRMAMADGGELIVLAPALKEFGEDKEIDRLIRKYGYRGTPQTLKSLKENQELANNLSAAAHLIHGSSEGRFFITYCPGHLTKEEIESVNFNYAGLQEMMKRYNPETLKDGYNQLPGGEEIFYISNPAIGLWAYRERFKE
ncbi:MAG TPA: D-mannonate epimerase [Marinilabiliales bacterium]|jgi:nickel-dependent lactate racemase|nr:MAG: D-mannonate epimerase [Bacteroidetes bacterium GWA2_40_14]OFX56763.1 MAG: D-mannonate epimerase [Bacteroidetes bacterium GWC2_40_13]OFX72860.1 MAG: D-mannonate epimerase [Bacteroidetes bacterium GWD2_40_43]OFX93553.1 MAG: D-mannonate epimerase [Bacteroidetes bacterium GWE2_40_63]OFZ27522.1 MAG: D-mannonate epimerase [Bacteroidetes bacterium RIFOXYC2_FULL_40_12]HAM99893.1 D-mannonate epimerase [Marinilabiliales bacterium]